MAERKKSQLATEPATTESDSDPSPTAAESFGSDDLGRIQGILFGDHAKKTTERIDTLENALLGVIGDLRSEIEGQLAALGERIDGEAETRTKALRNLTSRVTEESKSRSSEDATLRKELEQTAKILSESVEKASAKADKELDLARTELSSTMDLTSKELGASKVDRDDLAELFTATANKLAGN